MRDAVYIAGPMRGYPNENAEAFDAAAARFRAMGHRVVSPLDVGYDLRESLHGEVVPTSADYLRADIRELLDCDAIALLPGWERSTGARCEATVAVTLGLFFYCAATGQPIDAPTEIVCRGGYERPADLPPELVP